MKTPEIIRKGFRRPKRIGRMPPVMQAKVPPAVMTARIELAFARGMLKTSW
jgi:hypothetical protein